MFSGRPQNRNQYYRYDTFMPRRFLGYFIYCADKRSNAANKPLNPFTVDPGKHFVDFFTK